MVQFNLHSLDNSTYELAQNDTESRDGESLVPAKDTSSSIQSRIQSSRHYGYSEEKERLL